MRLIDADAAKKKLHKELDFYYKQKDEFMQAIGTCLIALFDNEEELPTIEAEPVRHGRWVKRGNKWQCTHCKILMNIDGTPEENLLNYCTYCGTKMDSKEEEHG